MSARALLLAVLAVLSMALVATNVHAHPLNPALLDVRESKGGSCEVLFRVPVGGPVNAPIQPVLPSRCARRGEPTRAVLAAGQSVSSTWHIDCGADGLVGAELGVTGLLARHTEALLHIQLRDGRTLQTVLRGDQAIVTVPERSSRWALLRAYVNLGMRHIASGVDHQLFILGLVLLVRDRRRLLWTATAFTAGHSVTLSLATLQIVQIPQEPIEVLIAFSIFVLGLELLRSPEAQRLRRRPWRMAFAFGLLHGFGFAGALSQAGLPAGEVPIALFSFNVGIELGQLVYVVMAMFALWLMGTVPGKKPTWAAGVPAYGMGALATMWMLQRL